MDSNEAIIEKRLLNEQETARYISMSRSFLRTARMDGPVGNRTVAPPFIRIGRSVRYAIDDLDSWIAENRHDGGVGEGS